HRRRPRLVRVPHHREPPGSDAHHLRGGSGTVGGGRRRCPTPRPLPLGLYGAAASLGSHDADLVGRGVAEPDPAIPGHRHAVGFEAVDLPVVEDRTVLQVELVDVAVVRLVDDRVPVTEEDPMVARVREGDLVQQLAGVGVQLLDRLEPWPRDPQRALVPLDAVDATALAVRQQQVLEAPAGRGIVLGDGRRANVRASPHGPAAEATAAQVACRRGEPRHHRPVEADLVDAVVFLVADPQAVHVRGQPVGLRPRAVEQYLDLDLARRRRRGHLSLLRCAGAVYRYRGSLIDTPPDRAGGHARRRPRAYAERFTTNRKRSSGPSETPFALIITVARNWVRRWSSGMLPTRWSVGPSVVGDASSSVASVGEGAMPTNGVGCRSETFTALPKTLTSTPVRSRGPSYVQSIGMSMGSFH